MSAPSRTVIRDLGCAPYLPTYEAMRAFTEARQPDTPDEIWLCEHPPVFTLGLAGRSEHVLAAGDIPVVQTNRGGQVTYHGPGQVVAYPLIDMRRTGYFVKELVYRIEDSIVRVLAAYGITGHRVTGAPGIYVRLDDPRAHHALTGPRLPGQEFAGLGKIAALGLKVSNHCSYHGMALNVAMDLEPYRRINPCGYAGLQSTDLASCGVHVSPHEVAQLLARTLAARLAV